MIYMMVIVIVMVMVTLVIKFGLLFWPKSLTNHKLKLNLKTKSKISEIKWVTKWKSKYIGFAGNIFSEIKLRKLLFGPLLTKVQWIDGEMVHKALAKIYKHAPIPIMQMIPANILEDAKLSTPQLIEKYGYSVETHKTVTEDGYLLEFYRILGKNSLSNESSGGVEKQLQNDNYQKPVVLLQAGVMDSSASWIITGPGRALGYKLADVGYDVWLMNHRGVKGSRAKHEKNDPDDENGNYWEFTFHEIGIFDTPAVIDYILLATKHERLNYIGHSQGCASFLIMASERPEYCERITEMHALAPSIFMRSTRNLTMKLLTFLVPIVINSLIPIILGYVPGNASVKQLYHFAQLIRTGKFQPYESKRDYMKEEINVPIHIYYGDRDKLATKENAEELHCSLKIKKDMYVAKEFGHMDFLWARNTNVLYDTIIAKLNEANKI